MSIVSFKLHGDWSKTEKFLKAMEKADFSSVAERYGQIGVDALSRATPVDTGKTASSWGYVIEKSNDSFTINWINSNVNDGVNIAIILQYGHGTRNGGYVQGRDYINPALQPVFEQMCNELWKEVTGVG